jgi:hypothetical protein
MDKYKYCDVFGRMPSLLGYGKLNTLPWNARLSSNTRLMLATKNERPQQYDGRCFLLSQPDVNNGSQYSSERVLP